MKCFIKSLLGMESSTQQSSDVCTPLPPIVKSLVGSVVFIALMSFIMNLMEI